VGLLHCVRREPHRLRRLQVLMCLGFDQGADSSGTCAMSVMSIVTGSLLLNGALVAALCFRRPNPRLRRKLCLAGFLPILAPD
jgi:hypothetical protein